MHMRITYSPPPPPPADIISIYDAVIFLSVSYFPFYATSSGRSLPILHLLSAIRLKGAACLKCSPHRFFPLESTNYRLFLLGSLISFFRLSLAIEDIWPRAASAVLRSRFEICRQFICLIGWVAACLICRLVCF